MIKVFSKFRIPTLLGLSLILIGIIGGVFLVIKDQPFTLISQASPDVTIPDPNITNITNTAVTISFETNVESPSFITYGINAVDEDTILDDRDTKKPNPRKIHYFTIKNLKPETNYQYKIQAGKNASEVLRFQTAKTETMQNGFSPVIGSVLSDKKVVNEGIAYLIIPQAITQSALIKNGNFLIPISYIRKSDLTDTLIPKGATGKITVLTSTGKTEALFNISPSNNSLPPINIGQNLDLTVPIESPTPSPTIDKLTIFDLYPEENPDGKINAGDSAVILRNFGKNPKNTKADINKDGVVDNEDLRLMGEQINQ